MKIHRISKPRFAPIAILFALCLLSYSNGQTSSRTLTVNDWSGSWNFTGFTIGSTSNDYYHLLSSADANQCALIREDASNNVVYAKLYSDNQCAGLSLNTAELFIYFLNNEASYFGLYAAYASNGSISTLSRDSTMNISGGVNTIIGDTFAGLLSMGGNIRNSAGESCAGVVISTLNYMLCSATEVYLGTYVNMAAS